MSFASLTAGTSFLPTWSQVRYLATGVLTALALLLLARRTAGALVVPLSTTTSLACGFALGALVLLAEWIPTPVPRGSERARLAALAAAVLLPSASAAALVAKFVWVPAVAISAWLRRGDGVLQAPVPSTPEQTSRVRQQWTRTLEADGRDVCRGSARAEFAAGQRIAAIHLAFCPPFAATPQFEATAAESDVAVKVGQVLPYAARIEVKLSESTPAGRDVVVAFTAASSP